MLSKSQIKLITSLQQKKYRIKHKLFVVEGVKSIKEFIDSDFELENLFFVDNINFSSEKTQQITGADLKKISSLKNPNQALAIFRIPQKNKEENSNLTLVLDAIQDPGNLGTIIRLCDWFGIKNIVCSINTVDCFNPKVIQATMGSLTRVSIKYTDLKDYLTGTELPIYASLLEGENIYKKQLHKQAIIIMGNEGNGISNELINLATDKINIPHFGNLQQTESLNVATATGIILSEFCRG